MKLLIVTNNLPPYTTASSDIMYQLGDLLAKEYGIELSFLGYKSGEDILPYRTWQITTPYAYNKAIPIHLSKPEKLLKLVTHPQFWSYRLALACCRYPMQWKYRQTLKRALREDPEFDCVLCSIHPCDTLYAATRVVKDIPVVAYKLDPWGTHVYHKDDRRYWEDEQRVDRRCSAIFVTEPIWQDYACGINEAPLEKVHKVEFPNLKKPEWIPELAPHFEKGKLHCAYVGQLYAGIRSPEFLFDLFRHFEHSDIVLHIIGNTELQAEQYRDKLPSNVVLHGIVSPEAAAMYMQAADVLVNLGNTVANQLPSKLISYLACGKPILNFCKITDCPSLPYMEKYPLALNVMEPDGLTSETVSRVAGFLRAHGHDCLTFEAVEQLFPACTPDYVAKQIYDTLCSVIETKPKEKEP